MQKTRKMRQILTSVAMATILATVALPNDKFIADLKQSTVSGIYIGDTKEALIEKWGPPEGSTEEKLLYPTRGASVDFIRDEIHAIYLWVSQTRSDEAFPEQREHFRNARVTVVSKNGRALDISPSLTKQKILEVFGAPDNDTTPYPDGSFGIEYMGSVPENSKPYLHLCFEFKGEEFLGLWMTH